MARERRISFFRWVFSLLMKCLIWLGLPYLCSQINGWVFKNWTERLYPKLYELYYGSVPSFSILSSLDPSSEYSRYNTNLANAGTFAHLFGPTLLAFLTFSVTSVFFWRPRRSAATSQVSSLEQPEQQIKPTVEQQPESSVEADLSPESRNGDSNVDGFDAEYLERALTQGNSDSQSSQGASIGLTEPSDTATLGVIAPNPFYSPSTSPSFRRRATSSSQTEEISRSRSNSKEEKKPEEESGPSPAGNDAKEKKENNPRRKLGCVIS